MGLAVLVVLVVRQVRITTRVLPFRIRAAVAEAVHRLVELVEQMPLMEAQTRLVITRRQIVAAVAVASRVTVVLVVTAVRVVS